MKKIILHTTRTPSGRYFYLVPDDRDGRAFIRKMPMRRWLKPATALAVVLSVLFSLPTLANVSISLIRGAGVPVATPRPGELLAIWGFVGALLIIGVSLAVDSYIERRQRRVHAQHPEAYLATDDLIVADALHALPRKFEGVDTKRVLWVAGMVDDETFNAMLERLQADVRRAALDERHEQWMRDHAHEVAEGRRREQRVDELIARNQRDEE